MTKSRYFVLRLLLIAPLFLTTATTQAAAPVTSSWKVRLEDATIPWLFALGSFCSEIPAGIEISPVDLGSDRLKVVNAATLPDGRQHLVISDRISGTAADNLGEAYSFNYINVVTLAFDGAIVTVQMRDTFTLKGGDVNYTAGFNWRWAYAADGLTVSGVTDGQGTLVDVAVSPFPFATSDGVNEDPSILPGSWQQLSTRGDPISCDPL
jgi:hypothetical protein